MRKLGVLIVLAFALAGCGGDDEQGGLEEELATTTAATTTAATAEPTEGCTSVEQPEPKEAPSLEAPTETLDADRTYEVTIRTNCGDFTITLDPKASPQTTASFVALAEADYFDGTFFHRIVPGFVIQGGDPTGTGTGGPGYTTVDTPAQGTTYTKGVVAMAKTAVEAPGTAGSQFFVVTAPDAGLPPDYAVIGTVTDGLDVVEQIGMLGDPTEKPTQPVVIDDAVVATS